MAIAPEQMGIGIGRHFTTPDVHPYDQVRWERRDARITNFRDGSVAFEQLGVEVPDFWSINATNILAQKYFRGTLGLPERETSLKQVADRVADTIAEWGIKDGYFVDASEAETFRNELKYLIVNQRAAFNSPVWFNIGVKGVPQQASACQPWDALVSTPDGLVPIGRLVETNSVGAKVYDAHGLTKIVAVKANGVKPVLRLHTKAGHTLDVTPDHLVWRASDARYGSFVRAEELRPGDTLTWHRTESYGAGEITSIGVAEAALAGWLQGDGFVGRYEGTNRSLTIEAMTVTPAERAWVLDAVDKVFPGVHRHERQVETQDETLDCRRTRLYGNCLEGFVGRWNLLVRGSAMTVPEELFTAPLPVVAAYLRSLFQAEGYVSVRERGAVVGLDMISEELVRGMQRLLLRFGIFSRVRPKADSRENRKGCWSLSIGTLGDRRAFADEIGFIDPRKANKLEASFSMAGLATAPLKQLQIDRVEQRGLMEVFDIQTESGEYLSGNLRVHNCFILAVEDTMDSILNWYVEEGTIFKGGSGSGINLSRIRSSREHLRGGGTASGPVSFMRGADASAGTIKCLHEGTVLLTNQGALPIRDVKPGALVQTRDGLRPVSAVHDNGIRSLVRVRTSLGDELLCTPEHRFWARSASGEGWREAKDLTSADAVLLDANPTDPGQTQPLSPVPPRHHNEIARDLPSSLDEAFALWLGWLWGDGSVTTVGSANFIAVQVGDDDPELVDRYRSLVHSLFGDVNVFLSRHRDKRDASSSVRFCSTQVIRLLERNGLRKPKSLELAVPHAILSSPAAARAAFLSGLFEADGTISNGYPTLSTVSGSLARDAHRLLLSIGIPSTIGLVGPDLRDGYSSRPLWTVRIIGGEGVRRFAKLVGFISERKSRSLEMAVIRKTASAFETQWVLPEVVEELDVLWRRAGSALRRALAPYCRYAVPRSLSLFRAKALIERFPDELHGTVVERFAIGNEFWARVVVEPADEGHVFDLTVADVHEYLVQGLVTHNSGGKTRRAAKMVVLNADHPDIEDFIWCKAIEESKARALRDAGFDMDLDGKDSHSIQYQNANNSVRVTDEFMQAVVDDADWHLRAVTDGRVLQTVKARALFHQIAKAAWECADPGMQFDTTINKWHTASNTGPINASNPCFTGDSLVHTDKGLIAFKELFRRANDGEQFSVYTHDLTSGDDPAERVVLTTPDAFMITGYNQVVRLRFSNGMELRCTPGHKIFTDNRGYVAAEDLSGDDQVHALDLPAPAINADVVLPVSTVVDDYRSRGDHGDELRLPETWSHEFAHLLGWQIGDGSTSGNTVAFVYGNAMDRSEVQPRHQALLEWINGDRPIKPSEQANGTVQVRLGRRPFKRFLEALGVASVKGPEKQVPWSIQQAPADALAGFLQGLFDADGCVRVDRTKGSYVGLGSTSRQLLVGVQRLLTTFGVHSRIYAGAPEGPSQFSYTRNDGSEVSYRRSASWDLRISGPAIDRFAAEIGFSLSPKQASLAEVIGGRVKGAYRTDRSTRLVERTDDGVELTYNLSEPRNHSYIVNGVVVRNCSEYVHLDNSACNLASINLLRFLDNDGTFDVAGYKQAIEVVFTAQEILVGNADYPTAKIDATTRRFRQLGLGYANLGALLMALGLAYDSEGGRALAAALTALLTGHAYTTSARTAMRMGPFAGYSDNREPMNNVLKMHRAAVAKIDEELVATDILSAAQEAWDTAVELAEVHGVRNAQSTVLAPTGTISFLLDCDTTGIEPDLGLVKTKKLVGGGNMSIVNQTVPRALRNLGYDNAQVDDIVAYIDEHKSIVGAPHLSLEHLPVFACSMGDNTIHYMGHIKMMGAVQPFISGAISKTANMPEDVTVEDVEQLHIDAWKLGLKAIAIYRDNCKVGQPLSTTKKEAPLSAPEAHDAELARKVEQLEDALQRQTVVVKQPIRERLPRRRKSSTFAFRVADCEGYVTVGEYDDGRPGEVFMKVSKQGSTLAGIMDAFSISVSLGLQHGVPLATYVRKYTNMRFEPAGITDDPDLRIASSLVDYIFRRLAVDYLPLQERAELGILTTGERIQPTLPGVEEGATPSAGIVEVASSPTEAPPREALSPAIEVRDAPYCYQCGNVMQRAGSCFVCTSCGTTSGCS